MPIFAIDAQHRVIAWNKGMEELTQVRKQDILGKGDYAHAVPIYGIKRPMLIDMMLQPDPEMERSYSFYEEKGNFGHAQFYFGLGAAFSVKDASGENCAAIQCMYNLHEAESLETVLCMARKADREITSMSQNLVSSLDTEEMCRYVLKGTTTITESPIGLIGVAGGNSPHGSPQWNFYVSGLGGSRSNETKMREFSRRNNWLVQLVTENRLAFVSNDAKKDSRFYLPSEHLLLHRCLVAPLLVGEEVLGVIAVANAPRNYSRLDLSMVRHISNSFSLALKLRNTSEALAKANRNLEERVLEKTHELEEANHLLTWTQRFARVGGFSWTRETGQVHLTKEAQVLLGFDCQTIYRHEAINCILPEDRNSAVGEMRDSISRKKRASFQFRQNVPNQEGKVFRLQGEPKFNEQGNLTEFSGFLQDITELVMAEKGKKENEEISRQMFEETLVLKLLIDPKSGCIFRANKAACQFFESSLVGINVFSPRFSMEDFSRKIDWVQEGHASYYIFKHRDKSGEIKEIEAYCSPVKIGETELVYAILHDITERKRAEEKNSVYQDQLRALAAQVSLEEEKMRRAIAADLHDGLGQNLSVCKIKAKKAGELVRVVNPEAAELLDDLSASLQETIEYTRSLTASLSPPMLYDLGLHCAIQWLGEQFCENNNIAFKFSNGGSLDIGDEIKGFLFRSVRELLVNIVKHSRATEAQVNLKRKNDILRLEVRDNGQGFEDSGDQGFGMFNIRERLKYLGGNLSVFSNENGSVITIEIPCRSESDWREVKH